MFTGSIDKILISDQKNVFRLQRKKSVNFSSPPTPYIIDPFEKHTLYPPKLRGEEGMPSWNCFGSVHPQVHPRALPFRLSRDDGRGTAGMAYTVPENYDFSIDKVG